MNASLTYYNNDLPNVVTYANGGTTTEYVFDDAERPTTIRHRRNPGNQIFLQLVYTYTARDLVETITETDENSQVSTTTFTYDVRGRLRHEVRTGQSPYDLTYTYDQLGNRLTKVDALANRTTAYTYDVSDPLFYGSKNNRLVKFTVSPTGGPVIETVWYAFDAEGNVTRKIRLSIENNIYTATLLVYNSSKQVEYVIGEAWTSTSCPSYTRTYAWRFRYDAARQRYMRQQLDLTTLAPIGTEWSDYDGVRIYSDFTVAGGAAAVSRTYQSGVAELPPGESALYWQRDLIGSNRTLTSGSSANPSIVRKRVYTAFGQVVASSGTADSRYRYGGAIGYQSADDIPFLHLGLRYYDPEIGRFLQRDPIGISGGLNVYEYAAGNPVTAVDPSGLLVDIIWDAANIIYDIATGSWGDLGVDVACAAVPFVPAGVSRVRKAAKVFTPNQAALVDVAKQAKRTGVSPDDVKVLKTWGDEYGVKVRGPETHPRRPHGKKPHIHVGPIDHIPMKDPPAPVVNVPQP
jgi:RHS repeat-associated protein